MDKYSKIDLRFWPLFMWTAVVLLFSLFLAFVAKIGIEDGPWRESGDVETVQMLIALFAAALGLVSWRFASGRSANYTCILSLWIFFAAVAIATREIQSCSPSLYEQNIFCFERHIKRVIALVALFITILLSRRYVKFTYDFIAGINWKPLLILGLLAIGSFILNEQFESRNLVAYEELLELVIFSLLAAIPCHLIWTARTDWHDNEVG